MTGQPDPASAAVVRAVAERTGLEAAALPPLYDAVDPDALDALFARAPARSAPMLTFRYAGCLVTVARSVDREITVEPLPAADADGRPEARRRERESD